MSSLVCAVSCGGWPDPHTLDNSTRSLCSSLVSRDGEGVMGRSGQGRGGFQSAHLEPCTHTPKLGVEFLGLISPPLCQAPRNVLAGFCGCITLHAAAYLMHNFGAQKESECRECKREFSKGQVDSADILWVLPTRHTDCTWCVCVRAHPCTCVSALRFTMSPGVNANIPPLCVWGGWYVQGHPFPCADSVPPHSCYLPPSGSLCAIRRVRCPSHFLKVNLFSINLCVVSAL